MADLIDRQAAIDAVANQSTMSPHDRVIAVDALVALPPAQPDLDEWCTNCKEYDQERHCCPRWNRVIRNTLKEAQTEPRWIPVTERLPEAYKRVLICNDEGRYLIGFVKDLGEYWSSEWRYQFDMYDDDVYEEQEQGKIVAWMPLPTAYERSEE